MYLFTFWNPLGVELDHLKKVEENIARRYGRLSGSYIDSADLFQAVKDGGFQTKDKQSLSDLQELDIILRRRLELNTGLPSVVSVHFLRSSIVLFTKVTAVTSLSPLAGLVASLQSQRALRCPVPLP